MDKSPEQIQKDNLAYNDTSIGTYLTILSEQQNICHENNDIVGYQLYDGLLGTLRDLRKLFIDQGHLPKPSWWKD